MDDYDNLLAQVRSKPETAAPIDDYDSLLTQVRQDRHPQVQSALQLSSFKKPDQEAERANLVRDLKAHLGEDWSPVAVEPEEAKRRLKIAENDHVLQNSPRLAQKYLDTGFADRTFDDVKPLSEIESAIGKIGQAGAYVLGSSGSAMSRLASGFYGYLVEMPADMISTYATKPMLGKSDPFGDISSWGAQNRKSLEDRANQIADVTGGGKDAGYLARMGYGALESVFQNLVTMPFAVESAAGKTFTAGKGAIASAMEAAQAIDLKSLLPMMVSTAGQAYGKASDQGMSPAQAALFATLQGGAEGLTERIGLGALVRDVKMSAPLWKVLRNQLATENITEQAATHWQDFNEWAMLPENKDKTFGDYLSDRPGAALDTLIQTSIATVLQTSVMRASMRSMRNQMSESQIGQLQEQNLKDIIAAVSSSQTTQRTPQDVIDLIESVDGENATEVHINANIASEVLNQSQLATLVTPEQLEDAAMHGGDIVIPISQFAVAVAQDPSMQPIVEHARTDPDMPSGAETRKWEAANGEAFQKELEAVTARHEADSEFQQSAKEVEDFVFNQMKGAGRHTESVNRSDALMHKAFASVMAERTGMKPMDFFKQHMLRVIGEKVVGDQFDQSGKLVTDTPAFRNWFGESKVVDAEGKPLVVYHGTHADITEFKKTKDAHLGFHFGDKEAAGMRLEDTADTRLDQTEIKRLNERSEQKFKVMRAFEEALLRKDTEVPPEVIIAGLEAGTDINEILAPYKYVPTADEAAELERLHTDYKNSRLPIMKTGVGANIGAYYLQMDRPLRLPDVGNWGSVKLIKEFLPWDSDARSLRQIIEEAKERGYDGIVYQNRVENPVMRADSYIAFEPTQIKSATGNNGQFNPNDPNILHQSANREAYRWQHVGEGQNGPVFVGQDFALVPVRSIASETDFEPGGFAESGIMGHAAHVTPGSDTYLFKITDRKGNHVGELVADVLDNTPVAIHDIEVYAKSKGLGTQIAATLAANTDQVRVVEIIQQSEKFWESVGVQSTDQYHNGSFDWQGAQSSLARRSGKTASGSAGLQADRQGFGSTESADGSEITLFQSEKDSRDLVITHNLSADNLLHAVKMGGIPVPSLAVTKAAHPMVNFGDITLLGAKEMADPKGYAKTKVFGADIYSPRYPEVTFKLDSKAVNKLNAALEQYRDGREIYGGEIRKVEDLTQTAAFRKYMLEKTGKTDVWDLRSGDMDAEASRMLAEVGAEEKLFKGFDYNGNRRYVPHTLENVVKILKQELRGGENFNYGVGSLRAKFTPEFKSIEQIRKAKDRLMDKAGFEAVKEEVDHELVSIAESLDLSLDQTIEVMEDAPKMGVQRAIERAFDDYGKDVEITPEVKQQVAEYLTKLRNLPTEYFEAKILRDVDLAEFSGAVVPEGVDPKVIEALQARGIKDIRTYKKGDEADRAAKIGEFEHLFFQNKGGNRGSFNPDTNTIALLQNADLSTFLHESGHYFLEVIADVASQPNAPAQIKQDMDVLLGWFGVQATQELSASEVWSMMTLEEKRQYHEQFARGFESYLFEGKAPSLELQGIFSRFRRWLLDIYKSISSLDVQLTDEVRGVMDRMLATDEQIADAEAARRFAPIFQTQEESGMDDAQWAAYQAEPVDATDAAAADLQARSIRDMRWLSNAKSKKMAELQKASKALRDVVTMDVRREVMSQPIYMVWNFLSGKPEKAKAKPKKSADLDPTTDSLFVAIAKLGGLDRLEIVQTWGTDPEDIKKLPRQVFGKPIVRTNDGKSIDELAQRLSDYGYLATDEHGKVDVRDLEDLFAAEMRGDEQYSNQKDYAAAMQDREPGIFDLENFPHGKLDSASVQQFYGSDSSVPTILEGLKMLGQDGYLPDEVATEFGFSSGDDMMRQLAVAQSPNELIAQMVDQRMLSDHAELSSEQAIEAAAEAAIHNDVRSKFLTRELNALRKAVGKSSVLLKAARDFAAQKIASLKVRDAVKSNQHTAAEARSAREADKAFKAGKLEEAATHKRDQVLNHELARASLSAKAEIAQIERWLKRFDNVTTRKAISYEYRDQIDALLEKFDLRQSVSDKELERRRSLSDWIASQEAMGLDPAIDDRLTRDLGKKHIRDLTLDELRGLKDSIANIEHLGRLKNQLLTAAKNRNLAAASAEIAASLNKYGKGRGLKDADIGDAHGLAALKQFGEGFAAEHRKLASIARQMDGDQDGGPMWEYFIRSMNAAGDKEATMRAEMSEKLASLFDQIKGVKLGRKEQVMPGVSMTRENILMMALNWGNAGNRQRLMDGGLNNTVKTLTETQVNSIIGRLSKEEMDFVQGVWDLLEANRPAIAAQELRLTGVEPKWVEPTPVVTDHGTYRGGYFPAKYDGNFSSRSNELEAITDLRQQMQGAAGRAQTRRGYTQERAAEVVKRPLKLGFSVLTQHINEVTHRLAWQDWLIDTYRLLKRDEIEQAIRDHYGPVMLKQIKDTVKDIAAGDIGASSMMERGLNHMRTGATIAGLGWNLTTSFLQPLGLTQSVVRIGWGPVARGMKAFIAHPWKTIESVESRSAFMKNRAATMNREINDVLNNVRNTHISRVEGSFFYTIQMMQKVADMPTWLGEYEKQIAAGNDDARAIAMADQAVIDAQGAGQMKDLAAIQRGVGPWGAAKKLFTNFYSYFNVTYNLAVERGRATDFKSPTAVGKLAADYLMLFTVPAILGALLKELVRGSDDDWDKEKILKKLAKEQLNYLMGTMVLTREIGAAITSDYGYSGPAGVRLFAEVNKLAKQAEQGEIDKALVKSAINVAGVAGIPVIGQFPAGQVNRTIDGIVAVSEGTAGPQAVIFGAPLKH